MAGPGERRYQWGGTLGLEGSTYNGRDLVVKNVAMQVRHLVLLRVQAFTISIAVKASHVSRLENRVVQSNRYNHHPRCNYAQAGIASRLSCDPEIFRDKTRWDKYRR